MPTLEWIGKRAVVNHHREVPFRLLQCDPTLSVGDPDSGNLLVQGDNLEALKALLPYYAGKVKCIYIDPPYNTGNEGWIYNDNVNSPEIKAWLGKVVGGEFEDLSRHDKWLCMMYPRIALLRDFLREDGVIFLSIDDNEFSRIRHVMEDIFGEQNFLAQIIIQSNKRGQTYKQIAKTHEYLLCYGRSSESKLGELETIGSNLPEEDRFGKFSSRELRNRNPKFGRHNRPNLFFPIFADINKPDKQGNFPVSIVDNPGCVTILPFNSTGVESCWRWGKEKVDKNTAGVGTKTLYAKQTRKGGWRVFEKYRKETVKAKSIWFDTKYISEQGTNELGRLGLGDAFQFPKPVGLIQDCILLATDEDSIILDSFAGSGTTAQAVMNQNAEDGGIRRFILVEMEPTISREVTAERLKRVINGYGDQPPLGGGFRYCTLGEPLFDETGAIRDSLKFHELAAHIFFTETGSPIPRKASRETPLLGVHAGRAVYLLFNGVLGDKRPKGGNVLTREVLTNLPPYAGPKVIYGESCRLGEARLRQENITFKQVPYDVQVR